MAKYNLPNLSKIQLPSGNEYRLTDHDLREMVNVKTYAAGVAYSANEIIYDSLGDTLYRVTADITAEDNTQLSDVTKVETNISKELEDRYNELKALISGGTHYRGITTTQLTDGCSTNPIVISGNDYTAEAGDIVIYQLVDQYEQTKDQEFIFNGTIWNEFGSTGVLKALAFADTASGEYIKPTGEGSTTINVYDLTGNNAEATEVAGATDVEYVNGLTGTYEFTTDGIRSAIITDDGVSSATVTVVKGITGTQVFNTDAIKEVAFVDDTEAGEGVINVAKGITGTQTFVTSAIDSVELTSSATTNTVVTGLAAATFTQDGKISYAPKAEETLIDGECLIFRVVDNSEFGVNTTNLGVTTTAAQTGSFAIETKNIGLSPTAASTASFAVETKDLGLYTEDSNTGTFTVTTKHIHFTPSTTVTGVTVNTTTATVTVNPDTI